MHLLHPLLYQDWRVVKPAEIAVHETSRHALPPERLMQAVWRHQRIRRGQLHTLDERTLQILHPGFLNREAGPDFRQAVVQFNGEAPRIGDIEVDIEPSCWHSHQHDRNPDFSKVLLHVVWSPTNDIKSALPTLALEPFLDAPLDELTQWLGTDSAQEWPPEFTGACAALWQRLEPETGGELLRQAAKVRLCAKALQIQARARESGWAQALWESLFRTLGYKNNVWPMVRIAETFPALRQTPGPLPETLLGWQARLLGLSGLMPGDPPKARMETAPYLKLLWDSWWRERGVLTDFILPPKVWRMNGLRPANHPHRRLALAAHWLASNHFIASLEHWFEELSNEIAASKNTSSINTETPGRRDPCWNRCHQTLTATLQSGPDQFWSRHWSFGSASLPKLEPLLGPSRVTDIAMNALLPWLWARAQAGHNTDLMAAAETACLNWVKTDDNAVLKLARERLLGRSKIQLHTAAEQQGLHQIVHDFCDRSNAVCVDCRLPALLQTVVA